MKITIVAQHIFPKQTPRANRATELAKEFSKQGHEVTLLSTLGKYDYRAFESQYNLKVRPIKLSWQLGVNHSDVKINRTLIDKVLERLFSWRFQFPLMEYREAVARALKHNPCDLLISVADPHHIHWGCAKLKKENRIEFPKVWIADCGDPFMNNGNSTKAPESYKKYEVESFQSCDAITVPIADAKGGYYPEFADKIHVIPQGFPFSLDKKPATIEKREIPQFAYAGVFYEDIRNPIHLINYLAEQTLPFKLIIYTQFKGFVQSIIGPIKDKVEIKQAIPRSELLSELEKMDFLLNLENHNSPHQLPSKLIDYAICARPILSINPQKIDKAKVAEFLSGDYSQELKISNLADYHIESVAKKFLNLADQLLKNKSDE